MAWTERKLTDVFGVALTGQKIGPNLPMAERRIMRLVFLAFAAHAFTDNVLISTPACIMLTFAAAVFARGEWHADPPLPDAVRGA